MVDAYNYTYMQVYLVGINERYVHLIPITSSYLWLSSGAKKKLYALVGMCTIFVP